MKKVITFVLILLLAFAFSVNAYAQELEDEVSSTEQGGEVTDAPETGENGESAEDPEKESTPGETEAPDGEKLNIDSVLARVGEWWEEYSDEIESIVGFIVTAAIAAFYKKIKSGILDIINKIATLKGSSDAQTDKSRELVAGYNAQTDAITKLENKVAEMDRNLGDIYIKADEALEAMVQVADILNTVYSNSAALPQGIKNIVNLDYAKCMEILRHGETAPEAAPDEADEEN